MDPTELATTWRCLHDGGFVAVTRWDDWLEFEIECLYIAQVLGHSTRHFRIATPLQPFGWEPWDDSDVTPLRLEDLTLYEAQVMTADVVGPDVAVIVTFGCSTRDLPPGRVGGRLLLGATGATLSWATGDALATSELARAAQTYWERFGAR